MDLPLVSRTWYRRSWMERFSLIMESSSSQYISRYFTEVIRCAQAWSSPGTMLLWNPNSSRILSDT